MEAVIVAQTAQVTAGLHAIDWAVLIAYLLAMVAIGASFYKGQKTTKDFFLAGRSMSWLPVGLSVVATLFSAISYMAIPSSVQKFGLVLTMGAFMVFFCIPIVTRIFMPFYHRMQVYSAYEYLEYRFDVNVRCLASAMFIVWRIVWMSLAVFSSSIALWAATGAPAPLWVIIVLLGAFATFYTYLGGMKAVIWTDVIQFVVLFGGMAIAAIMIVFKVDGGVAGIFGAMSEAGKTSLVGHVPELAAAQSFWGKIVAFFCTQNATLTGVLVASFVGHIAFYCVDQATVQRYFTAKSLEDSQKSFWVNAIANVSIHFCLAFLGMALFAYFKANPHPAMLAGRPFEFDWKYPYFIATVMPAGVAGLLIAALYAATMSSVDSGINSCCTAFWVDFWRRLKYGEISPSKAQVDEATQHHQLTVARVMTGVFGVIAILSAICISILGKGQIIELTNKLVNSFCGPMFAIFLLGMFSKRTRPLGVFIGAVAALVVMNGLTYVEIDGHKLSWQWPPAVGLVVGLVVGYLVSLCQDPPSEEKQQWTLAEQRKTWGEGEASEQGDSLS